MQGRLDTFLVHVTFILLTDEWARLEVGAIFFHQNNCMGGDTEDLKVRFQMFMVLPRDSGDLSLGVRSLCLWEVTVNVETITGTENKATVKCLALDGTSRVPLPRPREHCGRLNEKNIRARGWGGVMWSIVFRTWHECFTYEHIAAVLTCTRCQHPTQNGIGLMRHYSYSLKNYAMGS